MEFGRWYHVAGVYDGTNLACYINGRAAGVPVPVQGHFVPSNHPLRIGGNPNDPDRLYNGLVDEVSLYQRALSPEEIQADYEAGSGAHAVIARRETPP